MQIFAIFRLRHLTWEKIPGSPCYSVQEATESWEGPEYEATNCPHRIYSQSINTYSVTTLALERWNISSQGGVTNLQSSRHTSNNTLLTQQSIQVSNSWWLSKCSNIPPHKNIKNKSKSVIFTQNLPTLILPTLILPTLILPTLILSTKDQFLLFCLPRYLTSKVC